MLSIITATLLNAAAADLPRSLIVDGTHEHDWSVVVEEADISAAIDLAYDVEFVENGVAYPQVLMRALDPPREDFTPYLDLLVAVDCERTMFLPVDAWYFRDSYEEGTKMPPSDVGFKSVTGFPPLMRDPIFRQACGADWTMPPEAAPPPPIMINPVNPDAAEDTP